MSARRIRVLVSDPSTIGRRRFPPERRFTVLREAEHYARQANARGLGATIEIGSTTMRGEA